MFYLAEIPPQNVMFFTLWPHVSSEKCLNFVPLGVPLHSLDEKRIVAAVDGNHNLVLFSMSPNKLPSLYIH